MSVSTNFSPRSEISLIVQGNFDHLCDTRRKPPKSDCIYRIGPAPREDVPNASTNSAEIGTLDSDLEDGPGERKYGSKKQNKKQAGSKALIIYFAKMGTKTNKERVDYRFLESLFVGGAQVNVNDKHGQTVLHEVARNWNTDLMKFFLERHADINKADKWGRTPLHLAAAVNHHEMVDFLIEHGANIHAQTLGELQTPIHYAAKYNAVGSLKVLIENKAKINDRDYKQRTPLFLAAEMAREDAALYLVETGFPVGVFDDTGMSCIALMIEKMPHIAVEALNQFQVTDTAFRKDYFYLNYLEYDPKKWREENTFVDEFGAPITVNKAAQKKLRREKQYACPTTALKLAVQLQEFDVIMHPVMQQLIRQKWNLFGKWGAVIGASIHFTYIMIWTMLAIFLPRDGIYYGSGNKEWRIFFEVLGVMLTLYFILKQIWESKITYIEQRKFRLWRSRQLNRDMEYCHPRWPQEKTFLNSEKRATRARSGGLLSDPWNILDFLTYISVLLVIVTRIVHVATVDEESQADFMETAMNATNGTTPPSDILSESNANEKVHLRAYTAALIFMWLHFMKSCRPFTTLGPFITMLGHVITDTLTFAFLFFEFFIPFAVGFWILFGGGHNALIIQGAGEESVDWEKFNDLLFSVWQVTLNVDFNYGALTSIDRLMAQVMTGLFFALSTVLCLNLYIALLSETFNRVYGNATANASLLQANTILQLEYTLTAKKAKKAVDYIQDECGPYVTEQEPDAAGVTEEEKWDKTVRNVQGRFDTFNDFLKEKYDLNASQNQGVSKGLSVENLLRHDYEEQLQNYEMYQKLLARDKEIYQITCEVHQIKCAILAYMGKKEFPSPPKYIPPPNLNIFPPKNPFSGPKFFPKVSSSTKKNHQLKNNEIFRSIMSNKADNFQRLEEENEEGDDDALSGSWEDVPMMQFDDNTYGDDADQFEESQA